MSQKVSTDFETHFRVAESFDKTAGVVGSPGWPDKYDESKMGSGDGVCKWEIKLPNNEEMLQINFMDTSLTSIGYAKREDKVELKGTEGQVFFKLN